MSSQSFSFAGRPLVDLTDRIVRDSAILVAGGAFGDVYKCRCRDTPGSSFLVAVKTLRYFESEDSRGNQRCSEDLRDKVQHRELGFLRRLEHKNIVPLLGVAQGFGLLLAIVSPWMPNGTLHTFLKNKDKTLTAVERLQLAHGIGSGLEYLHSIPIFHGDLHSGNVLIDEEHHPRIGDFGLASTVGKLQPGLSYLHRLSSNAGAVRWAAPERLSGCEPNPSSDIYSFGCIMFELLSGDVPWKEENDCRVIVLKLTAHKPPSRPTHAAIEDRHWELMVRCWSCPQQRPSAHCAVAAVQTFLSPENIRDREHYQVHESVIVVAGESARKTFFENRAFDLTEGFKALSGAIPMIKGVTSDLSTRRIALLHKRLASVQKNDHLRQLMVPMLEDCHRVMDTWGPSGTFNPFEKIYELVFQTTVRSIGSQEIADDPALVARLKSLYDTLDSGTTPATVLFPWLPGPSTFRKLLATKEVYDIVSRAIDIRMRSGQPRNDTLQILVDAEDERLVIVGFIMGLLVAGARATGTTASWLITFLGNSLEWKEKAFREIEGLVSTYCLEAGASASLPSLLASIPLEAWEAETPVLDALIHETLRIAQPHTAMRRNLGPDTVIGSKTIPSGAYVVYPFSDVHLNPELYPDPWKFDPSRKEARVPFGYLGWGGGKVICLGQRLARLELKLITSMMLLWFRYSIVDSRGARLDRLPLPNWNDILLCRPDKDVYLAFDKVELSF